MDLAALEEIRRLKYRYLRCVDLKLWDEIGEVFTADAKHNFTLPMIRGQHDKPPCYRCPKVPATAPTCRKMAADTSG